MKKSSLEFEAFLALMRRKVEKYWKPEGESGKITRKLAREKHSRVGVGNRVMDNWSHYKISLQQNFFLKCHTNSSSRRSPPPSVTRLPWLFSSRSFSVHSGSTALSESSSQSNQFASGVHCDRMWIFTRKVEKKKKFCEGEKIISRISNSGPKHIVRTYRVYPLE